MAGLRTTLRAGPAALVLALALAPAALADTFDTIYADYQKDGEIDACKYSAADLKKAKSQVPGDIEAYAPDFPDALDAAADLRAGGGCALTETQTTPAAAAPTTTQQAAPPATTTPGGTVAPAPQPEGTVTVTPMPNVEPAISPLTGDAISKSADRPDPRSDAGVPAILVVLAAIGAALVLSGLLYALARWLAWDPLWARRGRHALGEAGWRVSATWAEFTDWVRFGR